MLSIMFLISYLSFQISPVTLVEESPKNDIMVGRKERNHGSRRELDILRTSFTFLVLFLQGNKNDFQVIGELLAPFVLLV